MQAATLTVLAATVLVWGPLEPGDRAAAPGQAIIPYCQVLLIHDTDVPAQEAGPLVELKVTEGDTVRQGDQLAQIDDRQALLEKLAAELERDAAQARADDDIDIRYAIKSAELADQELRQSLDINRKSPGALPVAEVRRQQLAKSRAELQVDRSRLDLKIAQMTVDVQSAAVQAANDSILRRRILAPYGGTVIDVYRQASEWVDAGEPVLRLVRLDQLRVDGFLNAGRFDAAEVADRRVTVEIELARGRRAQFTGRVVFVNPLVQAGNKYRIRAVVENRQEAGHWLLHPGVTATMAIELEPDL